MSATPRIGYAPRGDGAHIGYSVLGDGPVMVFWPGGTISAAALFEEPRCARAQRRLATFATTVAVDRPGVGYSDSLGPGVAPTIEQMAGDVLAVLDHLGVEKAVLSANGWDSQAMVHLAVEHPERVEKLILLAFSPCPLTGPDWPHGVPLEIIGAIQEEVAAPGEGRTPQDITSLMAPTQAGDRDLQHWFEEGGRVGPRTAEAHILATLQMDVRPLLPRITVPTIVLHSTGDRWVPVEGARFCAEQVPGAQLVEFDSPDHLFFTDLLEERMSAIEAFVESGLDSAAPAHAKRRLMTVLFTDLVGSTEQLSATADHRWSALLDEVDSTVNRHVRRHDGRVCKNLGDGHLALFERPSDAVGAALDLSRAMNTLGTPIRAGVHIGEVELRGDDVAGIAVHVGARVSALAAAGEVLVTRTVADLIAGSPYRAEDAGEHDLKGLPGSWNLFRVAAAR
ncbi:adenylate/guanylate cyclase domain-containing protein [Nocardioides marmorisolisilvae]|uniref:Adenylate/guanylate cyclase domain-containing protein n=1 Tax=Nocardioides marmorisolisilvae TaxID=1542737 RepID=A0A3N0DT27_9ACTN|nr:adenylate/guanylate cyclase domain-containing protein [Nocardioides marmorisolisilvae]RNL78795.1 adenylate/guanylate cyclase domain-containing protein [Nocardioides marmorisolisilvae]